MRHMLRQFGPCLKWPWTKLEAPELTESLIDRMVEGTQAQAAGRSIRELERLRDDCLVDIQQVLRRYNIGAGSTLRALEDRLYEASAADAASQGAPLRTITTEVRPEWVDYNGHMTDSRYLQVFGDATDVILRRAGINDAYRAAGHAMFTVETHMTHGGEAQAMEEIYVSTQVLEVDSKRVHLFHHMHRKRDDGLIATCEQIYIHVDTTARKAVAMGDHVRAKLDAVRAMHAHLPVPPQKGRQVGMARPADSGRGRGPSSS